MPELRMCEHNICDFCSDHNPTWEYPARDAVVQAPVEELDPPHHSIGAWLACDECAGLIQRNEWTRLAERCLTSPSMRVMVPVVGREHMLKFAGVSIKTFRSARSGRVKRYTGGAQ